MYLKILSITMCHTYNQVSLFNILILFFANLILLIISVLLFYSFILIVYIIIQ